MSDLSSVQTEAMKPPFTNTGVDLFGPILVKHRRARIKRWGAVFTCLTTCSVYIEVVEGLDKDSFINTLVRFINRRRRPERMTSDCGTKFKETVSELNINSAKVNEFVVKDGIAWDFNPPASPHMAGVWERIVRTVKYSFV